MAYEGAALRGRVGHRIRYASILAGVVLVAGVMSACQPLKPPPPPPPPALPGTPKPNPIWAGYVNSARTFDDPTPFAPAYTAIQGSFLVPAVTEAGGTLCGGDTLGIADKSSTWFGIGGFGKDGEALIQAGINSNLASQFSSTGGGQYCASYSAFYELVPPGGGGGQVELPTSTLTLLPADEVQVTISKHYDVPDTHSFVIRIEDKSPHDGVVQDPYSVLVTQADQNGLSVEAIHEETDDQDPTTGLTETSGILFDLVTTSHAVDGIPPDGSHGDFTLFDTGFGGHKLYNLTMIGADGTTLASPGPPDTETSGPLCYGTSTFCPDGFVVTDNATSPAPPPS